MPNYKDDVDFSPWSWTGDGRRIYHAGFEADVVLTVDGDFENDNQRFHFCRDVVRKLDNYERRKPLTEEEIASIGIECLKSSVSWNINLARAIERAHGIV